MTVIDFFCGGGGFSEGFRQAGFDVIWAVDNWKSAVNTHNENHPSCIAICDDVIRLSLLDDNEFNIAIPDSDVIIGSPPCTSFSNSNNSGNADKTKGVELIMAYLRIVARKKFKVNSQLKYWILENVPKVKNHINSEYTAQDLGLFGNFNLVVKTSSTGEYNAKYYGVPSNRVRFFCGDFPTPDVTTVEKDLIPLKTVLTALGGPKEKLHKIINDPLYEITLKGEDVTDHHYVQELSVFEKTKATRLKQDKGFMGKMAIPENVEKPSRTIMATMSFTSRECFVLPHIGNRLRAPSIREVASLMSFPIDYRFYANSLAGKYRLVGNAVSPKMAKALAVAILKKENRIIDQHSYEPINHPHKIPFVNLNLDEIPIKEEGRKRPTAKFKYHIPYFKFATYRVELTNRHSNFRELEFQWATEIHYNQGREKARIFTPTIPESLLGELTVKAINHFLASLDDKILNFHEFQYIHCLTTHEIIQNNYVGPYELLDITKQFLDRYFIDESKKCEFLSLSEPPYKLPLPIIIGYYILEKFIEKMKNRNESAERLSVQTKQLINGV